MSTPHFLVFALSQGQGVPLWRAGFAVTKKVGKAVVRNRMKRVLREFFRLSQHALPALDMVVVVKRGMEPRAMNLALAEKELAPVMRRLSECMP